MYVQCLRLLAEIWGCLAGMIQMKRHRSRVPFFTTGTPLQQLLHSYWQSRSSHQPQVKGVWKTNCIRVVLSSWVPYPLTSTILSFCAKEHCSELVSPEAALLPAKERASLQRDLVLSQCCQLLPNQAFTNSDLWRKVAGFAIARKPAAIRCGGLQPAKKESTTYSNYDTMICWGDSQGVLLRASNTLHWLRSLLF